MEQVYIVIKDMNECFLKHYLEKRFKKDLISIDELLGLTEDLIGEVDSLEEQLEDLKQDLHDNYKPISASEMYDIDDRYFS